VESESGDNVRLPSAQKFVTAAVTGTIGWGFVVIASAPAAITAAEWLGLGVVAATAANVYAVPNTPKS
jgi:hypothetical protein